MNKKLEVLTEAISHYNAYADPESAFYQARNPLGLKAVSDRHSRDQEGFRTFSTVIDGLQAAVFDLDIKCSGHSRSKLRPSSSLKDLILVYELRETVAGYVAKFLRKALNDATLSADTPLSYFLN